MTTVTAAPVSSTPSPAAGAGDTAGHAAGHTAGHTAARTTVRIGYAGGWLPVCDRERLLPGRGVAALLPDGRQAALFADRHGRIYAISNRDPFTGAYVLSRGLVGSTAEGAVFVSSPLLKQRFDLASGACLDDDAVSVEVFEVRAGDAA
jgi:nitrite reductase (NADH) small subunit